MPSFFQLDSCFIFGRFLISVHICSFLCFFSFSSNCALYWFHSLEWGEIQFLKEMSATLVLNGLKPSHHVLAQSQQ